MSKVSERVKSNVTKAIIYRSEIYIVSVISVRLNSVREYIKAERFGVEEQSSGHSTSTVPKRGLVLSLPALLLTQLSKGKINIE